MGPNLADLQAALLLNNGAGYHFGRVNTKFNTIADGLSCILSEHLLTRDFPLLLVQAPSLDCCWGFLPNAELISWIVVALLQRDCVDPLTASKPLLTNQGSFLLFHGAMT